MFKIPTIGCNWPEPAFSDVFGMSHKLQVNKYGHMHAINSAIILLIIKRKLIL